MTDLLISDAALDEAFAACDVDIPHEHMRGYVAAAICKIALKQPVRAKEALILEHLKLTPVIFKAPTREAVLWLISELRQSDGI